MNLATGIKRSQTEALLDATERPQRTSRSAARPRGLASARGKAAPGCRSTSAPDHGRQSRPPGPAATKITARIDVGFGNRLFIRGEGNGLSWEQGQPLTCVAGAAWVWLVSSPTEASVFKLLLNDQVWCQGENLRINPGGELEITPVF